MVRAWYMDSDETNQRLPHMPDPPQFVSLDELKACAGVEYFQVDVAKHPNCDILIDLKKSRGYTYEDTIKCNKDMNEYEAKLKMFYEEHIHADEEIRLILDGSGYFDVRDNKDKWIRVEVVAGDLLILPAGVYHRFTLDTKDFIVANRLFVGEPVWKAHNRPQEEHPSRQQYLQNHPTQA